MNIIGKPPINPLLFYTGKGCGYILWILALLGLCGVIDLRIITSDWLEYLSAALFAAGLLLSAVSLMNLGASVRLGLPSEETDLKQRGLYRFSRNPMYLGFDILTLSSVLINANVWLLPFAIYSVAVYDRIIRAEERFLEGRFGEAFRRYADRVRRYV